MAKNVHNVRRNAGTGSVRWSRPLPWPCSPAPVRQLPSKWAPTYGLWPAFDVAIARLEVTLESVTMHIGGTLDNVFIPVEVALENV